jgi:threonine dehydrogenase-like Zn-dependent dehydrogenase
MLAVKLTGKKGVVLADVEKPKADENTSVVRVTSSGICGTDINEIYLSEKGQEQTPGHETVGVIEEPGPACKDFSKGARVLINCHVTCGSCGPCRQGDLIFCPSLKAIGFDQDGGMAEYVAVPVTCLRHLPDDISDEEGVLLTDALATSYSALKKTGLAGTGGRLVVFGAGPIGITAIFCASRLGMEVTAVDINKERLEICKTFGAKNTVMGGSADARAELRGIYSGEGFDAALQCTSTGKVFPDCLKVLKNRGVLVNIGVINGVTLDMYDDVTMRELRIFGSRNCNNNMLSEMMDFCRANREIKKLVTHHFPLSKIAEAYETSLRGEGLKILIHP